MRLQLFRPQLIYGEGTSLSPLKLSFVRYPPGTPEQVERRRLEYRVTDSKKGRRAIAPWVGVGGFTECADGFKPTVESHSLPKRAERIHSVHLNVRGQTLHGNESIRLEANAFKVANSG